MPALIPAATVGESFGVSVRVSKPLSSHAAPPLEIGGTALGMTHAAGCYLFTSVVVSGPMPLISTTAGPFAIA
jgi:hypothetical protein